jgi:hypothetical protein
MWDIVCSSKRAAEKREQRTEIKEQRPHADIREQSADMR